MVGKAGSVTYDLEIPNFTKDALVLSGIALTSSTADETVTIWPSAKPLDGTLPAPFTAAREFNTDETVTLYAEVYENANRGPHTVDFKVDLRDAAGRVVSRYSTQRASTGATKADRHGFVAPIRLANADPGPHVLRIEAMTNPGAKHTVTKEIPIRVR